MNSCIVYDKIDIDILDIYIYLLNYIIIYYQSLINLVAFLSVSYSDIVYADPPSP